MDESSNLSAEDRLKFARAKVLSRRGETEETREIMRELAANNTRHAVIRAVFANTLVDCGDYAEAESEFYAAVQLRPTSELISLGLFHCLWDQGKTDQALKEIKRFLEISDSEDYRKIVEEIYQKYK